MKRKEIEVKVKGRVVGRLIYVSHGPDKGDSGWAVWHDALGTGSEFWEEKDGIREVADMEKEYKEELLYRYEEIMEGMKESGYAV